MNVDAPTFKSFRPNDESARTAIRPLAKSPELPRASMTRDFLEQYVGPANNGLR